MSGYPSDFAADFGNRITELERFAIQTNHREQELCHHLEEVARAVIKIQGGGGTTRDRNMSEFRAVLNLRVLTADRAGFREWHTTFANVMSQVRPGMRELLQELDMHKDEVWTEQ